MTDKLTKEQMDAVTLVGSMPDHETRSRAVASIVAEAEQRGMERARLSAAIQSYRDALKALKGE